MESEITERTSADFYQKFSSVKTTIDYLKILSKSKGFNLYHFSSSTSKKHRVYKCCSSNLLTQLDCQASILLIKEKNESTAKFEFYLSEIELDAKFHNHNLSPGLARHCHSHDPNKQKYVSIDSHKKKLNLLNTTLKRRKLQQPIQGIDELTGGELLVVDGVSSSNDSSEEYEIDGAFQDHTFRFPVLSAKFRSILHSKSYQRILELPSVFDQMSATTHTQFHLHALISAYQRSFTFKLLQVNCTTSNPTFTLQCQGIITTSNLKVAQSTTELACTYKVTVELSSSSRDGIWQATKEVGAHNHSIEVSGPFIAVLSRELNGKQKEIIFIEPNEQSTSNLPPPLPSPDLKRPRSIVLSQSSPTSSVHDASNSQLLSTASSILVPSGISPLSTELSQFSSGVLLEEGKEERGEGSGRRKRIKLKKVIEEAVIVIEVRVPKSELHRYSSNFARSTTQSSSIPVASSSNSISLKSSNPAKPTPTNSSTSTFSELSSTNPGNTATGSQMMSTPLPTTSTIRGLGQRIPQPQSKSKRTKRLQYQEKRSLSAAVPPFSAFAAASTFTTTSFRTDYKSMANAITTPDELEISRNIITSAPFHHLERKFTFAPTSGLMKGPVPQDLPQKLTASLLREEYRALPRPFLRLAPLALPLPIPSNQHPHLSLPSIRIAVPNLSRSLPLHPFHSQSLGFERNQVPDYLPSSSSSLLRPISMNQSLPFPSPSFSSTSRPPSEVAVNYGGTTTLLSSSSNTSSLRVDLNAKTSSLFTNYEKMIGLGVTRENVLFGLQSSGQSNLQSSSIDATREASTTTNTLFSRPVTTSIVQPSINLTTPLVPQTLSPSKSFTILPVHLIPQDLAESTSLALSTTPTTTTRTKELKRNDFTLEHLKQFLYSLSPSFITITSILYELGGINSRIRLINFIGMDRFGLENFFLNLDSSLVGVTTNVNIESGNQFMGIRVRGSISAVIRIRLIGKLEESREIEGF